MESTGTIFVIHGQSRFLAERTVPIGVLREWKVRNDWSREEELVIMNESGNDITYTDTKLAMRITVSQNRHGEIHQQIQKTSILKDYTVKLH